MTARTVKSRSLFVSIGQRTFKYTELIEELMHETPCIIDLTSEEASSLSQEEQIIDLTNEDIPMNSTHANVEEETIDLTNEDGPIKSTRSNVKMQGINSTYEINNNHADDQEQSSNYSPAQSLTYYTQSPPVFRPSTPFYAQDDLDSENSTLSNINISPTSNETNATLSKKIQPKHQPFNNKPNNTVQMAYQTRHQTT